MTCLLDSSVLVSALVPDEERHQESLALLTEGCHAVWAHAFLVTFATLTGGRLGIRVDADFAARLLIETVQPRLQVIELDAGELLMALADARSHGVRGGAVYDYLHLVAARKANAGALQTLNLTDFAALRRDGDPVIECP